MIKILGPLKGFPFWCGAFMVPFFKNGWTKLMQDHFSHTGCAKKLEWPYFLEKIEIEAYDQNICYPKKFCLFEVVHLCCLF